MIGRFESLRGTVTSKVLIVGLIVIVLLVPFGMIENLIAERGQARRMAVSEVSRAWGQAQTLGGPVLAVPIRYRDGSTDDADWIADEIYLLPEQLSVDVNVGTQVLSRGIYDIPVYTASLSVTGRLRPVALGRSDVDTIEILWPDAVLALPVSDARPIDEPVRILLDGDTLEFQPGGNRVPRLGPQLVAPLGGLDPESFNEPRDFSFELTIGGTGALRFLPLGDLTDVEIRSSWPSPSFGGAYLPDERTVTGNGFSAQWRMQSLGRGYPSVWRRSDGDVIGIGPALARGDPAQATSSFGVELIVPVGIHEASLRATKFAVLFLVLTFAAFFLFDTFQRLQLHAIQYLSIGLANGIFYLLLIAVAEHVGFGPAYLVSAAASTALIGGYASAILGTVARALPITGLITVLYGFLYTTLVAEDYALLIGSIGLFALLATFMYLTRHTDWRRLDLGAETIG
jgi:inner membrane protein